MASLYSSVYAIAARGLGPPSFWGIGATSSHSGETLYFPIVPSVSTFLFGQVTTHFSTIESRCDLDIRLEAPNAENDHLFEEQY